MKIWQGGLLIAGAAVAGILAVRLAEPPPTLKPVAHASSPEPSLPATAPPAQWKAAPQMPEDVVASAPPAVYTQPPPPPPPAPKTAKPKPFAIPHNEPVPVAVIPVPKPVPYQEPAKPARHVTLDAGAVITVRFAGADAVLDRPVVAAGMEIAEKGARVMVRSEEGNKLRMVSFQSADGQRVEVTTDAAPASGDVIRFRLAARITITERKL
jgi:hypothetical protein